jgi:hypothetical protein
MPSLKSLKLDKSDKEGRASAPERDTAKRFG